MAVETVAVAVSAATWTALSAGEANVLVNLRTTGRGYLFVGTAAPTDPPPDQSDYLSVTGDTTPSLSGLEATDNVYFFSFKACTVEVVRG